MKGKDKSPEQEEETDNDEDFLKMVALALKDGTLGEHGRNEPVKQGS